jgi:hypothetical protein
VVIDKMNICKALFCRRTNDAMSVYCLLTPKELVASKLLN